MELNNSWELRFYLDFGGRSYLRRKNRHLKTILPARRLDCTCFRSPTMSAWSGYGRVDFTINGRTTQMIQDVQKLGATLYTPSLETGKWAKITCSHLRWRHTSSRTDKLPFPTVTKAECKRVNGRGSHRWKRT
jgi:hypothetical protein